MIAIKPPKERHKKDSPEKNKRYKRWSTLFYKRGVEQQIEEKHFFMLRHELKLYAEKIIKFAIGN